MARPKSGKAAAKPASTVAPEVAAKVSELKSGADALFLKKDFSRALETYDQATKLVGDSASDKSDLLLKKAGCLMSLKKFKEAVKECSAVLDLQPGSSAALKVRSKGYEQMGFLKQALADVQNLNKTDAASSETRDMEKRLKDQMTANRGALSSKVANGAPGRAAATAPQYPYYVAIKCTLGEETKVIHASLMVSYADLFDAVKAKFPDAGPFLLHYTDKEGDTITITSRMDVQSYLGEVVTQYQKQNAHAPKLAAPQLPPLKIQVVPCAESDVPLPPPEELQAKADNEKNLAKARKEAEQAAGGKVEYEVDEWLVEFARLFSDVTGIDPAAHHEHINLGQDKLQKAMDTTLANEKAQPLFDKAAEHFRDSTCASFIQWGNVHIVKADRRAQMQLKEGKPVDNDTLKAMMADYNETEAKIKQALAIKADSWEATGSMAQLEWERLKAKLGYIVPNAQPEEGSGEGKTPEQVAADAQAKMTEALNKVLGKLDQKAVKNVQGHMDTANKWFEKALGFAKAAEESKKKEEAEAAAAAGKAEEKKPELTPEQQSQLSLASPSGNMLVMHGNILYEWSQVLAAVGQAWKPTLDSAVEKFRTAGAAETEIRSALKNHTRKDELDLGPDPEPAAPAPAPAAEAPKAEEKPQAKGLPSLDIKKKGGK